MATRQPPKRKVAVKPKPSPKNNNGVSADRYLLPITANQQAYESEAESPYFRDTLGITAPVVSRARQDYAMGEYVPDEKTIYVNPLHDPHKEDASLTPAGVRTRKNVLTHEGGHFLKDVTPNAFPSYFEVNRPTVTAPLHKSGFNYTGHQPLDQVIISQRKNNGRLNPTTFNLGSNVVTEEKPRFFGILGTKDVNRSITPSERKAIQALDRYYAFGGKNLFGDMLTTDQDEAFAQAYTNAAGFLSETAGDTTGFREKLGRYEGNTPGAGAIVKDLLTGRPIYKQHPLKGVIR